MIDIVALKKSIEEGVFDKRILICVCKSASAKFIVKQYAHYYANYNNLNIELIEDLNVIPSFGFVESDKLYVYRTDKLINLPLSHDNVWVICNSMSKEVKEALDDDMVVEIPKLEDWQIVDYVATVCQLTDAQAKRLISEYKDLEKLDIEIQKLSIFRDNKFDELVDQLFYQADAPVFDLVNGLVKRDVMAVKKFLDSGTEIEPFGFLALLKKNIKQVIDIQLAKNPSAEALNMNSKQFWAISKYSCGHYNREELLYIYDVLTSLDARIKSGDINTKNVTDYIISKFMELIK